MRPELKICASAQRILQFLEKKISSLWICTAVSTKEIILLFCLLQPRQCNVFRGNFCPVDGRLVIAQLAWQSNQCTSWCVTLPWMDRGNFHGCLTIAQLARQSSHWSSWCVAIPRRDRRNFPFARMKVPRKDYIRSSEWEASMWCFWRKLLSCWWAINHCTTCAAK